MLSEYKIWQNTERLKCGDVWFDSDRLFTKWDGKPMQPNTISHWFADWVKENNLPNVNIHSLRHTNATLLISGGIPIRVVSDMLGHSQPSTTSNIYTHVIQSAAAAAADTLQDILNPVTTKSKHA